MKRLARQILHDLAGEYVGLAPDDFEDAWQESIDALTHAGTIALDHAGRITRAGNGRD